MNLCTPDLTIAHYQEALAWCKLLLSGQGPTASAGSFNTLTLLYPMERIFEDYVAHCLHQSDDKSLFGEGCKLKTQVGGKALVENHNDKPMFRLRPDLAMYRGDKVGYQVEDARWQ